MSRLVLSSVVAGAILAFGSAGTARADFVLDDFSNPTPFQKYQITELNANPYNNSTTLTPSVTRAIQVAVTAPLPPNFNAVSGVVGGGEFEMSAASTVTAMSTVTYNFTTVPQNLSGATGLTLDFISLNQDAAPGTAALPVKIDIATSTGTKSFTGSIANQSGAFSTTFALASFTGTGNLSAVNSIKFTFNGTNGTMDQDFRLDNVKVNKPNAVPAPPALVLAGMGFVALFGRSRLNRRTLANAA